MCDDWTLLIESEKEDCTESTDSADETSYCVDDETAAPGEDEIAAMREIVLEGVSENDAEEFAQMLDIYWEVFIKRSGKRN